MADVNDEKDHLQDEGNNKDDERGRSEGDERPHRRPPADERTPGRARGGRKSSR